MPKNIVNVSLTSELRGAMGQVSCATAKAGIVGLTKTVAAEWGS
jgi:3-oxoacyl-[acyl-carrier protein] reductase